MLIQFPSSRQVEIPELDYLCPNGECRYIDDLGNYNHGDTTYQIRVNPQDSLESLFFVIKMSFMGNSDEHFVEYHPFSKLLSPRSLECFLLISNRTPQGKYRLIKDSSKYSICLQGKQRKTILKQLRILSTPLHRDHNETLIKFHSRYNYSWFSKLFTVRDNKLISHEFKRRYEYFLGFFYPFSENTPHTNLDLARSRSWFNNSNHGYKELLILLEHMNKMYLEKNANFIQIVNIIFDKFNEDDKTKLMRYQRDY